MNRTNIAPEILQTFFDSANNAVDKGQAQFYTPVIFAGQLAAALPKHRPAIADFNCGNGALLHGTANATTKHCYGVDIDPVRLRSAEGLVFAQTKIAADLTLLYPMMVEVQWVGALFVLNPPWDLHWHRDRLALLAESDLITVRDAYAAVDPRLGPKFIDSTIATTLIALDRSSLHGEGLVIANEATLQRLIFGPGAPYGMLARHIWLHVVLEGNPMTGLDKGKAENMDPDAGNFRTGVIYFAREHEEGPHHVSFGPGVDTTSPPIGDLFPVDNRLSTRLADLRTYRTGLQIRDWDRPPAPRPWNALAEEAKVRFHNRPPEWNLWLAHDGTIRTQLSVYEDCVPRIKQAAAVLHDLNGKHPMQMVLQRAQRSALMTAAGIGTASPWRVEPRLIEAVNKAVTEYHSVRAPLYPLSETQRLGYLDEEDSITVKKEFQRIGKPVGKENAKTKPLTTADVKEFRAVFQAGDRCAIRTMTVSTKQKSIRPNLAGEPEELELTGQELAIFIADHHDREVCFLDPRALSTERPMEIEELKEYFEAGAVQPLQALVEHFIIPEVPDLATLRPAEYQANIAQLEELERILVA